jgi:hypothetical protein
MNATTPTLPLALTALSRRDDGRMCREWPGAQAMIEENPWMQHEDIASAWAVSALTLAAVVCLALLALLG